MVIKWYGDNGSYKDWGSCSVLRTLLGCLRKDYYGQKSQQLRQNILWKLAILKETLIFL